MANLFVLSERWHDDVPEFISLTERTPPILRILRLLSGTVVIEPVWENNLTLVQTNYLNGSHVESQKNLSSFWSIIFEDEVPKISELGAIARRLTVRDRAFYAGLLSDVVLLLPAIEQQRNTEAFLLIYRLLEKISVALPLIYASREKSFRKANSFLQDLMGESNATADLSILDRFMAQYSENNKSFQNLTVEFDITAPQQDMVDAIISQVSACLEGQVKGMELIKERSKIVVPYSSMSQFLANLRHRCFHDQLARKNFDISKIGGPEILFSCFVAKSLGWFAYILVDVVRWEIERASK